MSGLIDSTSLSDQRDWRPVLLGVTLVVLVTAAAAFFLRAEPKPAPAAHPYAAHLAISDLKMSQAANFVGTSITYLDGVLSNTGDKTVTHAVAHVTFENSLDQVVQTDDLPFELLITTGPYPDTVDLKAAPLLPAQSKPFRLTFEHVSADWNHAYPKIDILDLALR
jgi:hypothetical protein